MRPTKSKALLLARFGMAGATAAMVLATFAAFNQLWLLWGVNSVLCLICGFLASANYRLAERL